MKSDMDIEILQRCFAEAVSQLGGEMRFSAKDLIHQNGRVNIAIDGDVVVCTFSGVGGKS